MKKIFKQIISCIVLIIFAVAFVGYIINYRASGELSFVSHKTPVYSTSDLNKQIYTLNLGDSFIALSSFRNNECIKIRFENKEGQEEIGFIRFSECNTYVFPLDDSYSSTVSRPNIILSFNCKITFNVFLKEFIKSIENYEVIGIYLEDSDYSEEKSNLSEIALFCEEQHIPYGFISHFTQTSVQNYIDSKDIDTVYDSYCILPKVFDIDAIENSYTFDKDLSDCIFRTASARQDNITRYWICSISTTHNIAENEILLMNLEEQDYVTYVSVSDEMKVELIDSYVEIESN